MYEIYQIMNNDTLDSIANKYNIDKKIIESLNPSSSFLPGTNIVVPTVGRYFDIYTIKQGDTLYEIARKYNTDYNLLALLNGLNVTDYIYPNMNIIVPKQDIKYYVTKQGDTLFKVARQLNANLEKMLRENNNIYLEEGQLIVYSLE